mgnify:CR=1 FL=1
MTNQKFNTNIENHKKEILNFFSYSEPDNKGKSKETPNFFFNFLNDNENCGSRFVGSRKQHNGAHFMVQYKDGFKYEDQTSYYITFNTLPNMRDNGTLAVSLRKELVELWGRTDTNRLMIMVVSDSTDCIYTIPARTLIKRIGLLQKDATKVWISEGKFEDYVISLDSLQLPNIPAFKCREQNHNELLKDLYFKPEYFKPEYIGNFTYSKYRNRADTIYIHLYTVDGTCLKSEEFRSIKEAYDFATRYLNFNMSEKTFQRYVAKEKTLSKDHIIFYASKNKEPKELTIERVVDESMPNPFFNASQPVDGVTNFPEIVVSEHYEIRTKDEPTVEKIEKVWNEIKDDIEIINEENEMNYEDDQITEEEYIETKEEDNKIDDGNVKNTSVKREAFEPWAAYSSYKRKCREEGITPQNYEIWLRRC